MSGHAEWAQCCVHTCLFHPCSNAVIQTEGSSFYEFEAGMWRSSLYGTTLQVGCSRLGARSLMETTVLGLCP